MQRSDVIDLPEWNYNGIQPASEEKEINNSTAITSLPQVLKENGYRTIHCGKAHFGARTTPGADPINMGFDVNIAGGANGAPGSYLGTKILVRDPALQCKDWKVLRTRYIHYRGTDKRSYNRNGKVCENG